MNPKPATDARWRKVNHGTRGIGRTAQLATEQGWLETIDLFA